MTELKSIILNGEQRRTSASTIAQLVRELDLLPEKVAVERNGEIVPRSTLESAPLGADDRLEIVHFVGGGDHQAISDDTWTVAGRTFRSRLIVGTGKYKDFEQNAAAVEASGAEIVTVAVRRVNVSDPKAPMLTDYIDPKKITYLPNTAGCFTAEDAIRTLRLAREAGGWDLVKLEVLGEARTLYPNMVETIRACEVLAKEGFHPMVYCVDDLIAAKQLEDAGAVAVMRRRSRGNLAVFRLDVSVGHVIQRIEVAIAVDHVVQAFAEAQHQRHPAAPDQCQVKLGMRLFPCRNGLGPCRITHRAGQQVVGPHDIAFPVEPAVGDAGAQGHDVQFGPQCRHLGQIGRRHWGHAITALILEFDQTIGH